MRETKTCETCKYIEIRYDKPACQLRPANVVMVGHEVEYVDTGLPREHWCELWKKEQDEKEINNKKASS